MLPLELAGLLPWTRELAIGKKSPLRPLAEQLLLDVLAAAEGSLSAAAAHLGGSTSQLSKLITADDELFTAANAVRRARNLSPLRRKD